MARRMFPGRPSHKYKHEIFRRRYQENETSHSSNSIRNIERNFQQFYKIFGASDDEDEFEGFSIRKYRQIDSSKWTSKNKINHVCKDNCKYASTIRQSDNSRCLEEGLSCNKFGTKSISRNSYDGEIKNGLKGIHKPCFSPISPIWRKPNTIARHMKALLLNKKKDNLKSRINKQLNECKSKCASSSSEKYSKKHLKSKTKIKGEKFLGKGSTCKILLPTTKNVKCSKKHSAKQILKKAKIERARMRKEKEESVKSTLKKKNIQRQNEVKQFLKKRKILRETIQKQKASSTMHCRTTKIERAQKQKEKCSIGKHRLLNNLNLNQKSKNLPQVTARPRCNSSLENSCSSSKDIVHPAASIVRRRRSFTLPSESMRSSRKIIPQKRYCDEYELQSILFKKIKLDDNNYKEDCEKHVSSVKKLTSVQTKSRCYHKKTISMTQRQKYMQRHKFYKWVPCIPSATADKPLVVEGKRQWKPSPKFQLGFAKHCSHGLSRFSLTLKNVKRRYSTSSQKYENETLKNVQQCKQTARENFAACNSHATEETNMQRKMDYVVSGNLHHQEPLKETCTALVNTEILRNSETKTEIDTLKKKQNSNTLQNVLTKLVSHKRSTESQVMVTKADSSVNENVKDGVTEAITFSEELQDATTTTHSHVFQNFKNTEISQDKPIKIDCATDGNGDSELLQTETGVISEHTNSSNASQCNTSNQFFGKEFEKTVEYIKKKNSVAYSIKENTSKLIKDAIRIKNVNTTTKPKSQPCIKYTRRIKFQYASRRQRSQLHQQSTREDKSKIDNSCAQEKSSEVNCIIQQEVNSKSISDIEQNHHNQISFKEIYQEESDDLKEHNMIREEESLKIHQINDESCTFNLSQQNEQPNNVEVQQNDQPNNVETKTKVEVKEESNCIDLDEKQTTSQTERIREHEGNQQLSQDSCLEIQSTKKVSIMEKKILDKLDSSHQNNESKSEKAAATVNCTICKQSKFPKHIKRHYGQFCCNICSKFFASFLRRPEQYYCSMKGCCPVISEYSSEREILPAESCKACWLKTCLDKFVVPVYTRKKIKNYIPKLLEEKSEELSGSNKKLCDNAILIFQRTLEDHSQNLPNSLHCLSETVEHSDKDDSLEDKDIVEELSANGDLSMLIDLDDCLFSDVEYVCTNDNDATTSESEVASGKVCHKLQDRSKRFFPQEDAASSSTLSADEDIDFGENIDEINHSQNSENDDENNAFNVRGYETSFKFYRSCRRKKLNSSSQKIAKQSYLSEKSSKPAVKHFLTRMDGNRKAFNNSTTESTKKNKQGKQASWTPRIKHVCRRASVVFGHPLAKFEKLSESDDFNLSALPREEKERILEYKTDSTDLDDLPLDELIRRASEKDGRDVIITPKIEKTIKPKIEKSITPMIEKKDRIGKKDRPASYFMRSHVAKKSRFSYIKNRLKKTQCKQRIGPRPMRRIRCKTCVGCLAEECGKCCNCLDKRKYGGPNIIKKACVNRRCLRPQYSLNSTNTTAIHHRKYFYKAKRHPEIKHNTELDINKDYDTYSPLNNKTEETSLLSQATILENVSNSSESNVASRSKNWKDQRRAERRYLKPSFIFADYWEEYDQDRIWNHGFPLISSELLNVRIICFLCGSAGLHDFIYCNLCCEPFHLFCVEDATFGKAVDQETWVCFRCQSCTVCGQTDELLKCKLCARLYHADCSGPNYPTIPSKNNIWICSCCIKCKNCSRSFFSEEGLCEWDFDNPYCERCTYCMKKGNFCPICHQCYEDDDYESKMVQCSKCQLWVHATCDNITDEHYEILSYLPESVVYICRCCSGEESRSWLDAVHEELIKGQKQILLALINNDPLNIEDRYQLKNEEELQTACELRKLKDLSLERKNIDAKFTHHLLEFERNKTTCTLTMFLRKVENEEYTTVFDFYEEISVSLKVHVLPVCHNKMLEKFTKVLKQYFPWFTYIRPKIKKFQPPSDIDVSYCIVAPPYPEHSYAQCNVEISKIEESQIVQPGKLRDCSKNDQRKCVLCGQFGDGIRIECGRLIYCGQNDWAHVNCALWSAEVFEEVDGSLQNVHPAISRGKSMPCEHCGRKGATIGCCIRGCPANYHFKCAQEAYAIFQDDKKIYCADHKDKVDDKAIANEAFFVKHCMYVDQEGMSPKWLRKTWQNGLPVGCVHVTIGSLTVESLGYLTAASDHPDVLVPVDFVSTRLFWSTKRPQQRVIYTFRTIEIKPAVETEETNISEHHTVAHSVEKCLLNKHHKRNRKATPYWNHKIPKDYEQVYFSLENSSKSASGNCEQIPHNIASASTSAVEEAIVHQNILKACGKRPIITKVTAETNEEVTGINVRHDNEHLAKVFNGAYSKVNGIRNYNHFFHQATKSIDLHQVPSNEALKQTVAVDAPANFNKNILTEQYPKKCVDDDVKDIINDPVNTILLLEENICNKSDKDFNESETVNHLTKEKDNISDAVCNSENEPPKKLNCDLESLNGSCQIVDENCNKNQVIENFHKLESQNSTSLFINSVEPLTEEVENISPKRLGKKQGSQKILKTYPLRSPRYQESIKLLKYSNDRIPISVNSEQKEKQQNNTEQLTSYINASKMCHIRQNSQSFNERNDNDNPRQLRKTRARSYFEHILKHKLLYKKNQALNNLFSGNCKIRIDHNSNSEIIDEKNSLYDTSFGFAIQKNDNLNNFTDNEIVVAVGEIEKFGNSLEKTNVETKRTGKLNNYRNNVMHEKTFKCKICKRQYRTRDSCEKHEQSCTFIVDSSSTDEDELDLLQNIESKKSDKENEASPNSCNSDISMVDFSGNNNSPEHNSATNSTISVLTSQDEKMQSDSTESVHPSNLPSPNLVSPEDSSDNVQSAVDSISEESTSSSRNIETNCNISKNKSRNLSEKFILPKLPSSNLNTINNYNSFPPNNRINIPEHSMTVNNLNMPIIVDSNVHTFRTCETVQSVNSHFVIPQQAEALNVNQPICIQNTCQFLSTGVNIIQNPHLSYLGSITISNQESLSLAFNLHDPSVQLPSNIIMDQSTSQITSNIPVPILNYPIINTPPQNTQTYLSQPAVINPQQVMYLNPVVAQTQVSESVFIVNSEPATPTILYEMPTNLVTSAPPSLCDIRNNFNGNVPEQSLTNCLSVRTGTEGSAVASVVRPKFQSILKPLPSKHRNNIDNKSIHTNTIHKSSEMCASVRTTESRGKCTANMHSLNLSLMDSNNVDMPCATETASLKATKNSRHNSHNTELKNLTSNKALVEALKKAAQQMLQLKLKNCQTSVSSETIQSRNDKTFSSAKCRSKCREQRIKHKANKLRRNSASSLSDSSAADLCFDDEDSIKLLEQLQTQDIKCQSGDKDKPYIMYEISSNDGFYLKSADINEAWKVVVDQVQEACMKANLKRKNIRQNGADGLSMMGLTNNAVRYLLEQLPGAENCLKYSFRFHSPLTEEKLPVNPSGCARSEPFQNRKDYDMFNFLLSKHRCPPEYQPQIRDDEIKHKPSRKATSMELPMAMRFRHLKNSAKEAVGVYRSQIHGRGLFCKRTIEAGEMVIEYAGEVIRSILTDTREIYYESKGIGCYMFRIDDNEVVDATMHGNAARFINHSCEPNCYSKVINVDGKKHIVIFAMKRIVKGEELTYNYKFPIEDEKIPCTCGTKRCRKYLN